MIIETRNLPQHCNQRPVHTDVLRMEIDQKTDPVFDIYNNILIIILFYKTDEHEMESFFLV